jgi:hypothetical protein
MDLFDLEPPEHEIFRFQIISPKKTKMISNIIGVLLITNFRVIYKQLPNDKKNEQIILDIPLKNLKIKFKREKRRYRPHIILNKKRLHIDIYNNKLVARWLKKIRKIAKNSISQPIFITNKKPKFLQKLEKKHQHMAAYMPPPSRKSVEPQKLKSKKLKTISSSSQTNENSKSLYFGKNQDNSNLKSCPLCGAKINKTAKFCVFCGHQIA